MSEGRIARQGTVAELKKKGELDFLEHEVKEIEQIVEEGDRKKAVDSDAAGGAEDEDAAKKKKARKLVEDEIRSEGGVKWEIYKTYLKAS